MLIKMIVAVAEHRPDVRGAYLDYLKKHLCLSTAQKSESEGEIIMGRWDELYPDLQEFYEYGGGDYHREEDVMELLEENQEKLEAAEVEAEVRQRLLEELQPFIIHSNAGLDDQFYALACATCRSDDEWRSLARFLESINQDWASEAREEYDEALAILLKDNYRSDAGDSCAELQAAKQLEQRFPEQVLAYYLVVCQC